MKTKSASVLFVVVCLAFNLLLIGCNESDNDSTDGDVSEDGDESTEDGDDEDGDVDSDAPDGDIDEITDGDSSENEVSTCNSDDLVGVWIASNITLTMNADLSYHSVGTVHSSNFDVTGTYSLDDCVLTVTDLEGVNPCPSNELGMYTLDMSDPNTLTFTLISDECLGRSTILTEESLSTAESL